MLPLRLRGFEVSSEKKLGCLTVNKQNKLREQYDLPIAEKRSYRMLEKLTGIRLIGLLVIVGVHSLLFLAISILPFQPDYTSFNFCMLLLAAEVSLVGLAVGAVAISLAIKLSINVAFLTWCLWILRWVSLPNELPGEASICAAVLITQSVVLFVGAIGFQVWAARGTAGLQFGILDFLVLVATFAVATPISRYVFSEWPPLLVWQSAPMSKIVAAAVSNLLWSVLILIVCIGPGWKPKQVALTLFLAIVACAIDFYHQAFAFTGAEIVYLRLAYIGWLCVSMLPIYNLAAPESRDARPPSAGG